MRNRVLVGAGVLALALVAASLLTVRGGGGGRHVASAPPAPELLAGIPQHGNVLGSPKAPLRLVEYADLQCPYCAEFSQRALPELIRDYVRTGRLQLEFRGLAFLGPDSVTALRAAVAAGARNHLWDVVHRLYAVQGGENAGWVTDAVLRDAGVDPQQARNPSSRVDRQIAAYAAAAQRDGIQGTPSFLLGPPGGPFRPLQVSSLDAAAFRPALDA